MSPVFWWIMRRLAIWVWRHDPMYRDSIRYATFCGLVERFQLSGEEAGKVTAAVWGGRECPIPPHIEARWVSPNDDK